MAPVPAPCSTLEQTHPGYRCLPAPAAPIRDAWLWDDVTTGPGDPLTPALPRLPGKQVSRNPSPLLQKRVPLTQGKGSGHEGSPADGAAPLCAAAGVAAPAAPPARAAMLGAPGCSASPSRWAYTTHRASIDRSAAGRAPLRRGSCEQPPSCTDGKSDELMTITPPGPSSCTPRAPRAWPLTQGATLPWLSWAGQGRGLHPVGWGPAVALTPAVCPVPHPDAVGEPTGC